MLIKLNLQNVPCNVRFFAFIARHKNCSRFEILTNAPSDLGKTSKKNCIKSEIGIIYLTPLPPYLKSEKQKNEILVYLRPPLPLAKSEKFGRF